MIYIEETLKSYDLPTDLIPHLLYGEVIFGTRKPLVFLQCVKEDNSLVGKTGTKISVPKIAQFSSNDVSQESESTIDTSGYSASEISFSDVDITIGAEIYMAVKLSKTLLEDNVDIDFVRNSLQNMGAALNEFTDESIRDLLISGVGTTTIAASKGTLAINDVIDATTKLKNLHWYSQPEASHLLIVNPDQSADLLKSTTFTTPERYTTSDITKIVEGEVGKVAGCTVLESEGMIPELALIVTSPAHQYGPSTILAWKRKMDVAVQPQNDYARTMYITSMRYGLSVVQSNGVLLISNC